MSIENEVDDIKKTKKGIQIGQYPTSFELYFSVQLLIKKSSLSQKRELFFINDYFYSSSISLLLTSFLSLSVSNRFSFST